MNTKVAATEEVGVDLGELNQSIGFLLRVAQVSAFDRFFAAFGEIDLRPGEFSAMWVIRRNPGLRQGLLADTLRIKAAHMTKMVRRLEERGFIQRVIPDDDRRSVRLFLTSAGEKFVLAHREAFLGQDDYHHHGLSPEDTAELARLLRLYVDNGDATP